MYFDVNRLAINVVILHSNTKMKIISNKEINSIIIHTLLCVQIRSPRDAVLDNQLRSAFLHLENEGASACQADWHFVGDEPRRFSVLTPRDTSLIGQFSY